MIDKIIEWSVKNRFLVMIGMVAIIVAGMISVQTTPVDAIPDLSDVQVIILTEYGGQGPNVVEDQVTYPLTTAMLSVPYAKVVRGYSFFGFSLVYIIFEDGTDLYWARSRVLEYLNFASGRLPQGVTPQLGPDATGVGGCMSMFWTAVTTTTFSSSVPFRTGTFGMNWRVFRVSVKWRPSVVL